MSQVATISLHRDHDPESRSVGNGLGIVSSMNPSLLRTFKAIRTDLCQEGNSDPEFNRSDTSTKPAWSEEWRYYGFSYWSVDERSRFAIIAEARTRKRSRKRAQSKKIQQDKARNKLQSAQPMNRKMTKQNRNEMNPRNSRMKKTNRVQRSERYWEIETLMMRKKARVTESMEDPFALRYHIEERNWWK